MTRQAQNCVNLFLGQPEDKILSALQFLSPTVTNELMAHFGADSRKELAMFLSERRCL